MHRNKSKLKKKAKKTNLILLFALDFRKIHLKVSEGIQRFLDFSVPQSPSQRDGVIFPRLLSFLILCRPWRVSGTVAWCRGCPTLWQWIQFCEMDPE